MIPNLLIIVSLAGILAIVLRRFPEARQQLINNPVPKPGSSKWSWVWQGVVKKSLRFLGEVKDLYHPAGVSLRVKQLVSQKKSSNQANPQADSIGRKVKVTPRKKPSSDVSDTGVKEELGKEIRAKSTPPSTEERVKLSKTEVATEAAVVTKAKTAAKDAKQLMESGRFAEARRKFMEAAPHLMQDADVWARLGYTHYRVHDYQSAVQAYEYALSLDSNHPTRYFNLSLAYLSLDNKGEALKNIDKALVLDDNDKYRQAKQHIISESAK